MAAANGSDPYPAATLLLAEPPQPTRASRNRPRAKPPRRRGSRLLLCCSSVLVAALLWLPALPDTSARKGAAAVAVKAAPAAERVAGAAAFPPSRAGKSRLSATRLAAAAARRAERAAAKAAAHQHPKVHTLAGAGASHDHGGGDGGCSRSYKGEMGELCDEPPLELATKAQKDAAWQMLAEAKQAMRYRDLDLAEKAGYDMGEIPDENFAHVHKPEGVPENDISQPRTIIYMRLKGGDAVPVGIMLNDGNDPEPTAAGPIFRWHIHPDGRPVEKYNYMGHIWFTDKLETAYAMELPSVELERIFGERERG